MGRRDVLFMVYPPLPSGGFLYKRFGPCSRGREVEIPRSTTKEGRSSLPQGALHPSLKSLDGRLILGKYRDHSLLDVCSRLRLFPSVISFVTNFCRFGINSMTQLSDTPFTFVSIYLQVLIIITIANKELLLKIKILVRINRSFYTGAPTTD